MAKATNTCCFVPRCAFLPTKAVAMHVSGALYFRLSKVKKNFLKWVFSNKQMFQKGYKISFTVECI